MVIYAKPERSIARSIYCRDVIFRKVESPGYLFARVLVFYGHTVQAVFLVVGLTEERAVAPFNNFLKIITI